MGHTSGPDIKRVDSDPAYLIPSCRDPLNNAPINTDYKLVKSMCPNDFHRCLYEYTLPSDLMRRK